MNPTLLPLLIYVAVALIAATVFLLLRDLSASRKALTDQVDKGIDLESLLPPTEAVVKDNSRLGRLASETGLGLTAETALLSAILVGLSVGGALFIWRDDVLAAATGAVLGMLIVAGVLFYFRARWHRAIRDRLPDCMDLMARAVRAGESLDQAITLAGNSGLRPMDAEFRYCASQMKMGLSLEAAIRSMAARIPLTEMRILAMTLVVQRRRGGSLPTTLERLARVFRDRVSFYRQFQAATALGRGSAALIALLALALDAFVVFGNSEYAESLLTTNTGRVMLATAVVLQILGITWALWLFRSHY